MSAVDTTQVQMFKVEIDFVLHNSNSKNISRKEMEKLHLLRFTAKKWRLKLSLNAEWTSSPSGGGEEWSRCREIGGGGHKVLQSWWKWENELFRKCQSIGRNIFPD